MGILVTSYTNKAYLFISNTKWECEKANLTCTPQELRERNILFSVFSSF
jgi:hypothetical protein